LLFETIKCENGVAQNLKYHERRMFESTGKEFDLAFLRPPLDGTYRCKLIYKDEIESVEFLPYSKKEIKTLKVISAEIEYSKKFMDRNALEALFALRGDCDDVLIVKDGKITDTTIANVAFLDKNGRWLTPKSPLLKGTMRQKLLDDGFLKEADISLCDIGELQEIAVLNALRGFEPLGTIHGVMKF
jgi:4-amino-4-deoxychorismate lyase